MKVIISTLIIIFLQFDCSDRKNVVVISTSVGKIVLELFPDKAPITVNNFYKYIEDKKFDNTNFYRTVTTEPDNQPFNSTKINVIQGGIEDTSNMFMPIIHETTNITALKHLDGTISMARDEPGTATSEFFICVGDQPSLDFSGARHGDGTGFAAFGKVFEGMKIVKLIHKSQSVDQRLYPPIKIYFIRRIK
ncbi:MAG: peptidylprolyl isomerase [Bacteroidetes bacterium]|nr:peptidylprolyl isomerase [Bacteroidota bacterium]